MNRLVRSIGEGFKLNEVFAVLRSLVLDDAVAPLLVLVARAILGLAQLTLEVLPVVRHDVGASLSMDLRREPALQTIEVDRSHGPAALARRDERVFLWLLLLRETDLADVPA